MYQLLYKLRPVEILHGEYSLGNIKKGKCDILDDLLEKCLQIDPANRIDTKDLENHPFLSLDLKTIEDPEDSESQRSVPRSHNAIYF